MIDQGLLAYLEGFITDKRKETFNSVLNERTRHFTVVLEDIYQPHNASAVVRSCDIFGVQDVYAIENRFTNKVSRHVAKGSQKWLNINRYKEDGDNTKACIDDLRAKGYQIIGTTPHTDSCVLSDFDVTKKSAFVFGAEKDGISDYIKQEADGFLKIPMVGFTESLNISVAAAITLNDVTARLRKTNIDWKLSKEEQRVLYFEWIKNTIKNPDKLIEYYHKELQNS
ncbi:RNA methyltransferase [Tenacibaculum finnmarkense genomovar finnmarkense]|uniref:tRNA (guanosine(18)-2'-O)-methyltransferase n=1 Tax=Tenacibaculum finnmarkense genomovar finnmarkense TaxID=1458503 RepID=A0AAP1RF96_9FLAO|nr:RNA methyltransferase [Tenacibaculum finnmarkense]MBE7652839.1 TrmH family RNA methyltransferase [Tenacibaculum finnmarkense genomovar finnmarkense]MBE7695115.1 TrmH family RNA methyltransferase [Tenacibaculum finnmarkense genomovar finnmarkense]MCD8417953.1 RNA methyltransferase [Tenacibaculum finnmarkense genomovar finnmarkense]MCD8427139.1 RNA methyltransferase [Tenacibaculum finnmarkense genomovar finnmarkense]MCD8453901.1 RNA methyltransferase [Tenacibaculum finnmarkense genomovar ulce